MAPNVVDAWGVTELVPFLWTDFAFT